MERVSFGEQRSVLRHLQYAAETHVGMRREENQDTFGVLSSPDFQIYLVADGMGGVKGGAIASNLAIEVFAESITTTSLAGGEDLVSAARAVNHRIYERGSETEELKGMGTTIVGLAFSNEQTFVFHVGDSRAYLLRGGDIVQLTSDHTLVNELVRSGAMSADQADRSPVSHMLTRSLGPSREVLVDCVPLTNAPIGGDIFLLCSDGLYNLVDPEEMAAVVSEFPLEEAARKLIGLANHRGGTDNITVILLRVDEGFGGDSAGLDRQALGLPLEAPSTAAAPPMVDLPGFPEPEAVARLEGASQEPMKELSSGAASASQGIALEARLSLDRLRESLQGVMDENASKEALGAAAVNGHRGAVHDEELQEEPSNYESADRVPGGEKPTRYRTSFRFLAVLVLGFVAGTAVAIWWVARPKSETSGATTTNTGGSAVSQQLSEALAPDAPPHDEPPPGVAQAPRPTAGSEAGAVTEASVPRPAVESPAAIPPPVKEPEKSTAAAMKHGEGDPFDGSTGSEDRQHLGLRLQSVTTRLKTVDEKLQQLDEPIGKETGNILNSSREAINSLQVRVAQLQGEMERAERKLSVWFRRRDELREKSPVNMAREVAVSSDKVKKLKAEFEEATYRYLKAVEDQRYNPRDQELGAKTARLVAERRTALDSLSTAISEEINRFIDEASREVSGLTLQRDKVQEKLQEAQWEERFAKALLSSDPKLKTAVREQLKNESMILQAEVAELKRLLHGYPEGGEEGDDAELALEPSQGNSGTSR